MDTTKKPAVVIAVQLLLLLNAAIWLFLAVWYLKPLFDDVGSFSNSSWIVSGLMFANALVMFFLAWSVAKKRRRFYYLALAVLAANIVLTVTDEFDLFDLIVLTLALVIVVLKVGARSQFMPAR
ncbi:MAG: hypothetical protein WA996_21305 [Candidatus Promineifilaceae bacterium]